MVDNAMNIHPQLQKDSFVIGKFPLCYLLLMKDANYPWFILVPDREDLTEIYQLEDSEQKQLISESSTLARIISKRWLTCTTAKPGTGFWLRIRMRESDYWMKI